MNTIIMNAAPTDWLTPATTIGAPATRRRSRSVAIPPSTVPSTAPARSSAATTPDA